MIVKVIEEKQIVKWSVRLIGGKLFDISAPSKTAARKLAEERVRKLRLHGDIESVELDKGHASRDVTYVVMDPRGLQVMFRGGLSRCVEYVMSSSGWPGDIRARSSTGKQRPLTEAEIDKFRKLMGRERTRKKIKL